MASLSDIVCNCRNTCNRIQRRGACPCRTAGRSCTELCSCGWQMPCINKESRPVVPIEVDVDPNDTADVGILQLAQEECDLQSEDDWNEADRLRPAVPASQKRKKTTVRKSSAKKRPYLDTDNIMDVDDATPSFPSRPSTQKRKKTTSNTSSVRRRLNIEEFVQLDHNSAASVTPATGDGPQVTEAAPVNRHHQAVQDFASSLDVEVLRSIVTELLFRDQAAFQDYVLGYRPSQPSDDPPGSPHPDDRPRWCRCGNCRPMPTDVENKCCMTRGAVGCVTDSPNFYTVVTPAILDIAIAYYNDFMVHDQERNNAAYRHQAYRQFILQRFGRLGHGNRRVVPSCVVLAIRRRFPDPRGVYSGFKAL